MALASRQEAGTLLEETMQVTVGGVMLELNVQLYSYGLFMVRYEMCYYYYYLVGGLLRCCYSLAVFIHSVHVNSYITRWRGKG